MLTLITLLIGLVLGFILLLLLGLLTLIKWIYDPAESIPSTDALTRALLPAQFCSEWVLIDQKSVHTVRSAVLDAQKPNLLFVHGTGSYALIWRTLWPVFSDYNIYAVDVPDFDFMRPYVEHYQLKPVTIIAHSYGAYTALRFAAAYPQQVAKLVLADCIGILPVQGEYAAYWAAYFASSPLQRILRIMGNKGVWLLRQWTTNPVVLYEYYMLLRPTDQPVMRRIYKNWWSGRSYWKEPVLNALRSLSVPLCLVYGEHDSITPAHQGWALSKHYHVPVVELAGVGHNIMSGPLNTVVTGLRQALNIARPVHHKCRMPDLRAFYADWNVSKSKKLYQQLYATLC